MTATGGQHITVLMTTYQERRYVKEQIDSVLAQSRPPDLLVVADDASTDGTLEVVRAAERTSRLPVRVLAASVNAGLLANLEVGFAACPPGIIVLADHDDVWRQDKVARLERAFADPEVVVWFSDAELVDADGRLLPLSAWEAVHFDAVAQQDLAAGRGLDRLLHGMTVVGATMAFRSELLAWALPLPPELGAADHVFLHDGWLAVLGCVVGRVYAEPCPLVRYRQHARQLTAMSLVMGGRGNAPKVSAPQQLRKDQARVRLVADRVRSVGRFESGHGGNVHDLLRRDRFLTDRLELLERPGTVARPALPARDVTRTVRHLVAGDYHRYARGVRTAGRDLALAVTGVRRH